MRPDRFERPTLWFEAVKSLDISTLHGVTLAVTPFYLRQKGAPNARRWPAIARHSDRWLAQKRAHWTVPAEMAKRDPHPLSFTDASAKATGG